MRTLTVLSALMILLSACSGGGGSSSSSSGGNTSLYSVGGVVSGLTKTVTLQNNGSDDLTVGRNGPFTFLTSLAQGATYEVTVKTQPSSQICVVGNGTGVMSGANVTSVTLTCVAGYSVSGVVSGLTETVILQNNSTDDLLIAANGPFTFSTSLATGATYAVTVKTQPPAQLCVVGNDTGAISGANVSNVTVTCHTVPHYSVGGVVSGLTETVTLQNNGTDDLSVGTNGPFTFPITIAAGATYEVTVKTQPPSQVCVVGNGIGVILDANVTNLTVTCNAAIAWDAPVSDIDGSIVTGVAGYKIYYGTDPGIYTGSIDVGNTIRYAISDFSAAVPQGATYYLCVTAYDTDATMESACSNEITR